MKKSISNQTQSKIIIKLMVLGVFFSLLILSGCYTLSESKVISTPLPEEDIDSDFGGEDKGLNDEVPFFQPGENYMPTGINPGEFIAIHSDPSSESTILGKLPFGVINLPILDDPIRNEDTIWVLIPFDQIQGWVKLNNLASHKGELPQELISKGQTIVGALKEYDYYLVADFVHPDYCLRFSPYPYLADTNLSFCPGELKDTENSVNLLTWGHYDGTGDPIQLTFNEYHKSFIYDSDFTSATIIGLNVEVSSGNSINNISDIFPDGIMIEYYFPGFDPQYGGMDWRSLRLVFINVQESWYLVAIVHGEWTI